MVETLERQLVLDVAGVGEVAECRVHLDVNSSLWCSALIAAFLSLSSVDMLQSQAEMMLLIFWLRPRRNLSRRSGLEYPVTMAIALNLLAYLDTVLLPWDMPSILFLASALGSVGYHASLNLSTNSYYEEIRVL